MPLSLSPASVDIAARLEELPRILTELTSSDHLPSLTEEDAELDRFLRRLRTQTGIDFGAYKRPTIVRRLQRRMVAVGVRSLSEYQRRANRDPDEFQRLASTFLIKVTEFFRDPDLFAHLKDRVVPELIEASNQRGRVIRVWSAGCATGEEAYSLAMLFAEVLGDDLGLYNIRIFATDIDNDAVGFARRGVYGPSAVENMPPELLARYFTVKDDRYEIKKHIRSLTIFGQHDLGQRAPFPRIDMAVARNVLIYFTPELQARALQLFAFSLREGGYLVLGKAESVTRHPHHFSLDEPRLRVYRRLGERVLIPAARGHWPSSAEAGPRVSTSAPPVPLRPFVATSRGQERRQPLVRTEAILADLPVGIVIVDRQYDILTINSAARRLLAIHGGAVGEDFVHVASRLPPRELRECIDRAFTGTEGSLLHEEREPGREHDRTLLLTFHSHPAEGRPPSEDATVILVQDRSEGAEAERGHRATIERLATELEGAKQRAAALASENEQLLAANHELNLANAEMRSSNEELLVGNEEIQAASEEVETLNEELQATNEELETLNEELQATVEELNTTNEDLVARSTELERLAAELEAGGDSRDGGSGLARVLADPSGGASLVDRSGRIVLAGEAFRAALDAGRLEPVDGSPVVDGLAATVAGGGAASGTYLVSADGRGTRRRRVVIEGTPMHDENGAVIGGLLVMRPAKRARSRDDGASSA